MNINKATKFTKVRNDLETSDYYQLGKSMYILVSTNLQQVSFLKVRIEIDPVFSLEDPCFSIL